MYIICENTQTGPFWPLILKWVGPQTPNSIPTFLLRNMLKFYNDLSTRNKVRQRKRKSPPSEVAQTPINSTVNYTSPGMYMYTYLTFE
jgi:hypothetical protein